MAFDWGDLLKSVAPAAIGAGATIYAANRQRQAINEAANIEQRAAEQNQRRVSDLLNVDPTTLPGYQAQLKQGEEGINRALRARGQYNSGAALKALTQYNSDLANQAYGQQYNRALQSANLMNSYGTNAARAGANAALGRGDVNQSMYAGLASLAGDSGVRKSFGDLWNKYLGPSQSTSSSGVNLGGIDASRVNYGGMADPFQDAFSDYALGR